MKRGDVYWANLDPRYGHEQSGQRPVVIYQADRLIGAATTVIAVPLTSNVRLARLPTCLLLPKGQANLPQDSVVLAHQLRVLDKARIGKPIGALSAAFLARLDQIILATLGIVSPE
jgi:mRNA interferase MazF